MNDTRESAWRGTDGTFDVVVPTLGGPGLEALLASLAAASARGPLPGHVFVIDDRKADGYRSEALSFAHPAGGFGARVTVLRSHGMGPAFARNVGWGASRAEWIAVLDDAVAVEPDWFERLAEDLDAVAREPDAARVAASYATVAPRADAPHDGAVALAEHERSRLLTSDAAIRRSALEVLEGFDPRFPRASHEDADLALRLERAGSRVVAGRRRSFRPATPVSRWAALHLEAVAADDAMLRAIHGAAWRGDAAADGRRTAIAAAALDAAIAALEGRRLAAIGYALAWALGTSLEAGRRFARGPRDAGALATVVVTAIAGPAFAIAHRLRGERAAAGLVRPRIRGVLFERDGSLLGGRSAGATPARVSPRPRAGEALRRLRAAHVRVGTIALEPGLATGSLSPAAHDAVQARLAELLGPFDASAVCAHAPEAACPCRPPQPELVVRAARDLGLAPEQCAVVGDRAAVLEAARAAGAVAILVPSAATPDAEVEEAAHRYATLERAVDAVLAGRV